MITDTFSVNKMYWLLGIGFITYVLLSLYFYQEGYIFNTNNTVISAVIAVLFTIGIGWLAFLINRLSAENEVVKIVAQSEITASHEIESLAITLKRSWMKTRISGIIKIADKKGLISSASFSRVLENHIKTSANIIRYISAVLILLGLLGTFLGLIQAVKGLQSTLGNQTVFKANIKLNEPLLNKPASQPDKEMEALYAGMTGTLGGLDKAFGTSIAGLVASIILGLVYLGFKNAERRVVNQLELVSNVFVLPHYQRAESDSIALIITESLNRALPRVIRQATDDLRAATSNLESATADIKLGQSAINKIVQSLEKETGKLILENRNLADWLREFTAAVDLIKDTQLAVTRSVEQLRSYVETKESKFITTTTEANRTLQESNSTFKKVGTYIKSRNERIEDIANQTRSSFDEIEKVFEVLNNTLQAVSLSLAQNQTEFGSLSNANRETLKQLTSTFVKLENSYQAFLSYTSSKDAVFGKILNESQSVFSRNLEVLDKVSSKLEEHKGILKNIVNTLSGLSRNISNRGKSIFQPASSSSSHSSKSNLTSRLLTILRIRQKHDRP